MTPEDGWPFLAALQGPDRDLAVRITGSGSFAKALEPVPDATLLETAARLTICLLDLHRLLPYRTRPSQLLDPLKEMQAQRRNGLAQLREAVTLLRATLGEEKGDELWLEVARISARVYAALYPMTLPQALAQHLQPEDLKRQAGDNEQAFNGWATREVARHVSPKVTGRYGVISALLAEIDVQVDKTAVRTLLTRTERK